MKDKIKSLTNAFRMSQQLMQALISNPDIPADQKQLMRIQTAENARVLRAFIKETEVQSADQKLQNTFKYEPMDFTRKSIWMHSVERMDTCNNANIIYSFAILLCLIAAIVCIAFLITEYPIAYPATK